MNDHATSISIEIAKNFIELMQGIDPGWERAYYRFRRDGSHYGSNGSYLVAQQINLIGALAHSEFFDIANERGYGLFEALARARGVFLLIIDSNLNYQVHFEWDDISRWEITKMNGASGLPKDL